MNDGPPKRSKVPPVLSIDECTVAWNACVDGYGYPATCPGVMAQGYFSAGFKAGVAAAYVALKDKHLRRLLKAVASASLPMC